MVINQLKLMKDTIYYEEEGIYLDCLDNMGNFEDKILEFGNTDLTNINQIYNNVFCFKAYSKIIYNENRIGIEANSEIMNLAAKYGIDMKIDNQDGLDFLLTNEDIIAIFEDDDDGDPDTGFFYFVGRVN